MPCSGHLGPRALGLWSSCPTRWSLSPELMRLQRRGGKLKAAKTRQVTKQTKPVPGALWGGEGEGACGGQARGCPLPKGALGSRHLHPMPPPILPHRAGMTSLSPDLLIFFSPSEESRDPGFRDTFLDPGSKYVSNQKTSVGTSLAVQWLRFWASTARGTGLIPPQGPKISHATRPNNNH